MTASFVLTYDSLTSSVLQYLERSDQAVIDAIPTFITLCEFEIAQQIKTLGQQQVVNSAMEIGNAVIPKPARWRKTVSFNLTIVVGEVTINTAAVANGILQAAVTAQPGRALFGLTFVDGRALGNINNDSRVTSADALAYTKWAAGTNTDVAQVAWIEGTLNPYMLANQETYGAYLNANTQVQPVYLRKYEYLLNYNTGSVSGLPLYYADYDYDHWLVSPPPDNSYPFQVLFYERIQPLSSTNQTNWLTQNAPNAMLYGTLLQAMPFLKNDQRTIFQQKYQEAMAVLKTEDQLRVGDRQAIAIES